MSTLTQKYEAVKADVISSEGWMAVHKTWFITSGVCFLLGLLIGHFWR